MSFPALNVLFLLRKVNCNDGIASYCMNISAGLKETGAQVHMVSGPVYDGESAADGREGLRRSVADWESIDDLTLAPTVGKIRRLRRLVRRHGISVINVHGLSMLLWGKALSLATGLPVVATYHPSVPGNTKDTAITTQPFNRLQRLYASLFAPNRLIVLSPESRTYLEHQSPRLAGRIAMISGGIDVQRYRPPDGSERARSRHAFEVEDGDLVCTLIGRLTWNKGHDLVVSAVRLIRTLNPALRVRCLFVGTGEHADEIRHFAHHDADDERQFRFCGYVDDSRTALWASDIFVLPSRLEGFALVIPEAMATGVVPIRTPSGGASEQIIPGETGLLIDFEDVAALAAAILRLSDDAIRQVMATNCIARAREKFSRDAMADQTARLYRSLIPSAGAVHP